MSSTAPLNHIEEAVKLTADATVDLFEARLKTVSTVFRWWNGPTTTWQGDSYEGLACQMTGEEETSDGSNNRPNLTVANPAKIFGPFAAAGYFDLAEVIRKRVLQQDFLNNNPGHQQRVWIVGRPSGVTEQILQLELRSTTDMPAWKTPKRTYSPPEFPYVTLNP